MGQFSTKPKPSGPLSGTAVDCRAELLANYECFLTATVAFSPRLPLKAVGNLIALLAVNVIRASVSVKIGL